MRKTAMQPTKDPPAKQKAAIQPTKNPPAIQKAAIQPTKNPPLIRETAVAVRVLKKTAARRLSKAGRLILPKKPLQRPQAPAQPDPVRPT